MRIKPVPQFLKELQKIKDIDAKRNIHLKLKAIENTGIYQMMATQDAKCISQHDLYEIRIRCKSINYRLLCTIIDNTCWILHLIVKKTQKLELHDINTASSRKSNLKSYIN